MAARLKPRPAPAPSPIIPASTTERTGAGGILRRANAAIRARWAGLLRDVLAIFDRIRVLQFNDAADFGRVLYALTPQEMAATMEALQATLDRWIADGREPADRFWFGAYQAEAAQLGTAQSVANLTRLSGAYAAARSLQAVVFSEPYATRVALAQIRSYEHYSSLSAGMRSELSQIIGRAVADGTNPRVVRKEIAERLGVSEARAYLYAQSEVTGTLRDARMAEAADAEERFGLRIGLLWTSALLPSTRPWHASRNGKVYTDAEVKAFYAVNGNRYRCHCAITECLLDEDGRPVLSQRARERFATERANWERTKKPR